MAAPRVESGILAIMSEMRDKSGGLTPDLVGFVDILLFGKAVGPTVVDTGYVGILGRMLKWARTGLVLLGIAGREVNGCERSGDDLVLGSRKTTSEDDLVPRTFRENLGGRRRSQISEVLWRLRRWRRSRRYRTLTCLISRSV